MPASAKIKRYLIRTTTVFAGTVVVGLGVLVLSRMIAHSPRAEAASVIYYPNFCLGGWKYPQHASGPTAVPTAKFDAAAFTPENSAYLESSVASQIFCGYFSVKNAKNPPTKAVISFNWNFAFSDGTATSTAEEEESYTSPEGYITIPAADIIVPAASSTDITNDPDDGAASEPEQTGGGASSGQSDLPPEGSTTTEVSPIPGSEPSEPASDDQSDQSVEASAAPESAPQEEASSESSDAVSSEPQSSGPSESAPASDAPQSFDSSRDSISSFIAGLIASRVEAAETEMPSFKDFLEVSYSLDGIRWTAIGRVNKDNWKGYKVEIPVTSWEEVKRLQIMLSVLPTIDQKPDIYLDSMSMRAEYDQTLAELAAQGLAAVSNAVDALIGDGNGPVDAYEMLEEAKKAAPTVEIKKRVLSFSLDGDPKPLSTERNAAPAELIGRSTPSAAVKAMLEEKNGSLIISGKCSEKYFVILTYKSEADYLKKVSSSVINEAHECADGAFSYDMASLPADTTRDGRQYLVVAEQGETGPWTPISELYPIEIHATTTIETIEE